VGMQQAEEYARSRAANGLKTWHHRHARRSGPGRAAEDVRLVLGTTWFSRVLAEFLRRRRCGTRRASPSLARRRCGGCRRGIIRSILTFVRSTAASQRQKKTSHYNRDAKHVDLPAFHVTRRQQPPAFLRRRKSQYPAANRMLVDTCAEPLAPARDPDQLSKFLPRNP
jgi:hypothetical protein